MDPNYLITSWDLAMIMFGMLWCGGVIGGLAIGMWGLWKITKLKLKIEELEGIRMSES